MPEGTSVWELSVGGGNGKAEEDYLKRTSGPDGLPTTQVTYIEAILEPWTKSRDWATTHRKEGRWRDVRGYNVDQIHTWLDQAPSTMVWLADQIGRTIDGAVSLTYWWEKLWLATTSVPLERAVVLAGRENESKKLLELLRGPNPIVNLGGDIRAEEALAFIAATLTSETPTIETQRLSARTIWIRSAEALDKVARQTQPTVFVISDPTLTHRLSNLDRHKYLIVSAPHMLSADIVLPRLDSQLVAAQLEKAGLEHDEARKLGALGRRSLLALHRTLGIHSSLFLPSWSQQPDAITRRLLLLTAWNEGSPGDEATVAEFFNLEMNEVQSACERLSATTDIPFTSKVGTTWHVTALEDSWSLIGGSLTATDLAAFRGITIKVLTEIDPATHLPRGERWKAGLAGARRQHSHDLRRGIATSLAILGSLDIPIPSTGSTSSRFVRNVVREIFEYASADKDYVRWESLSDIISLLAEAAPEEFIEALRSGLSTDAPLHVSMFQDNNDGVDILSPNSPHSNFLWALEMLAWSPDYIDDVVDLLAMLAEIDPGGKLQNRPEASLFGILNAFHPNTYANTVDQTRCIETIASRHPAVGRKLMIDLASDARSMVIVSSKPQFREWAKTHERTMHDVFAIKETACRIIAETATTADEFVEAIEHIENFPSNQRQAILSKLSDAKDSKSRKEIVEVYECLRRKIAHHAEYADCDWAMPEALLDELRTVRDLYLPDTPSARYRWLFAPGFIQLGDLRRRDNWELYQTELHRRRVHAVSEVLKEGGLDSVEEFARSAEFPNLVGNALAECDNNFDTVFISWLNEEDSIRKSISAGYLSSRIRTDGEELVDQLLRVSPHVAVKAAILNLTEPGLALQKVADMSDEVQEEFWRRFSYLGLGQKFSMLKEVAHSLLSVKRPAAVIDFIHLYLDRCRTDVIMARYAADAFEMIVKSDGVDEPAGRFSAYEIERVFEMLHAHRDEIGTNRLIRLEWMLFPISGLEAHAPSLHRAIIEDPGFFVELVTLCYREDSSEPSQPEEDRADQYRADQALRAYEVLRTCRLCPGLSDSGSVDPDSLHEWVTSARSLLKSKNRALIGDIVIGELLANAPSMSDGAPIHETVRDLLETLRSSDVERGLRTGIYNSRGVTMRGIYDGGAQEFDLANEFDNFAKSARKWPRTRQLLTELSESYRAEAHRLEAATERKRQGIE
ncbi:hypothetical protein [Gordonia namibiensis]|uniref:hypothetical protein n=1 Tax=Gordonia namibiensis TaxID=168480 RepID=UPI0012F6573A|nr:hypothetical protein [Gordonia namibiensis]